MRGFADIQEAHRQLRLRLRVLVGDKVFGEVTVSIPSRDDDELSFLRLVVWAYVLINETGRVALRFLAELPPFETPETVPEASFLRTWATHNLLPDKESDRKKLKLAWGWLREACGSSSPSTPDQWRACFGRLCEHIATVLEKSVIACEALGTPDDGPKLREELQRRIDRNWDAYRFDEHVRKAQARLGFDGIDVITFRGSRLDSWRKIVAVADEAHIDDLLDQRIERDLLDLMHDALPLSSREALGKLNWKETKGLGLLLLAIRMCPTTISKDDLVELLESLPDVHVDSEAASK